MFLVNITEIYYILIVIYVIILDKSVGLLLLEGVIFKEKLLRAYQK